MHPDDTQGAAMNSDFDIELKRRFAAAEPVPEDDAFVRRVDDALRRRRRRNTVLTVLGAMSLTLLAALAIPQLVPLLDLAEDGLSTITVLAGTVQDSPVAAIVLGALALAGTVVSWSLRRD
jgi:hypothetical protein